LAYSIDFSEQAICQYARLQLPVKETIARTLDKLADNPRRPGVRRVRAVQHLYRARAGDYRIIFAIHEARVIVHVLRVAHRSKAYRRVEALPPGWD
jgi:mRNA interferase RelE/StbE